MEPLITLTLPLFCSAGVFGLAIATLVGAILLRAATAWVTKIQLDFAQACLIVFVVAIVSLVASIIFGILIGAGAAFPIFGGTPPESAQTKLIIAQLASLVVTFLVASLSCS